jgi:hypothetical protein
MDGCSAPGGNQILLGLGLHTRPGQIVRANVQGAGHMVREVWDCMKTDLVRSDVDDIPEQLFMSGGLASIDNICQMVAVHHIGQQAAGDHHSGSGHVVGPYLVSGNEWNGNYSRHLLASLNMMARLRKIDQWD